MRSWKMTIALLLILAGALLEACSSFWSDTASGPPIVHDEITPTGEDRPLFLRTSVQDGGRG
jgi:hypothetical protein